MNREHIALSTQNPVGNGKEPRRMRTPLKGFAVVFAAVLIFGAGLAVGSGRIRVRGYSPTPSNKSLPGKLDYSSVDEVYDILRQKYDGKLDEQTILDGIKEGLAKSTGDPYTEFFNTKDAKDFSDQLNGTFEGIGAELGKDADKNLIVISPLSGYPAEKAGLKPKDIIAEIDGKTAYDTSINDAVSKIRGPKGTTVKLKIVRGTQIIDLTITREQINVPSVTSSVDNGIGYLKISRFGEDTADLSLKAANDFKTANVKGVILDLRGDPGGYLDAAVKVSSLWLQNKTVLTERRDNVIIETFKSRGVSPLSGVPTVVLINEGSASASEITAGALRDNEAAKLVGEKSYGKGSVQEPQTLPDGSLLKVTIARWFTPNGKNIDKEGITPDFTITPKDEDLKAGKDEQKEKAVQLLTQP